MNKTAIIVMIVVLGVLAVLMSARDTSKAVDATDIEPNDTKEAGSYAPLDYDDKDLRDEYLYKMDTFWRMALDPKELAEFLFTHTQFNSEAVDSAKKFQIVGKVAMSFVDDEETRQLALSRATDILSQLHIDCNWEALREISPRSDDFESYEEYRQYMEQVPDISSVVCIDGEPISSELNGVWDGPADK